MAASPYIANTSDTSGARDVFLHPRELMTILLERIWVGILVAVAVFTAAWLLTARQTPVYRSTATMIVEAQIPQLLNFQDAVSFNTRNLEYFNTHLQALHSRTIVKRALEESGLMSNAEFLPQQTNETGRISSALSLVSIQPVERSRMINISVEYSQPQMAADLANAIAHSYIQQELDDRMNANVQAIEWLRARSDEYRTKLEEGLYELQEYRENTQSVSLEEDQNIVIAKLKTLNGTLAAAEAKRISAGARWNALQKQVESGISLADIPMILEQNSVRDALQRLRDVRAEIRTLQQRYRPDYPDLKQALEEEERLEEELLEKCRLVYEGMRTDFDMLLEQEETLNEALQRQEKLAFELDRQLVRYNDLKRNVEADEEVYQAMIARMKEASLSGALPSDLIRLAEEARPAVRPFRPNVSRAVLRGGVLGVVLGIGSIFFLYMVDHRFRRSDEIERKLGLTVLAELPLIDGKNVQDRGMSMHQNPDDHVAETFRSLRAELMFKDHLKSHSVLLVTSTQAREGKSLIASNLALSMARDHRKTLLIGADLRRPSLETIFSREGGPGLADVLHDETLDWRSILFQPEGTELDVLSAGNPPDNPSELLGSRRMDEFMRDAKETYDRILIDATPVLGISDTVPLLPVVDGVLFIVRYGATHSARAAHSLKKIQSSSTPCVGAVMNGVDFRTMANAYYYRQYGSYARYGEPSKETATTE